MGGCCPDRDNPEFQRQMKLLALVCVIVLAIFFWVSLRASSPSRGSHVALPRSQPFFHTALQYIERIRIHHHIAYLRSISSQEPRTRLPMPRHDLDRG